MLDSRYVMAPPDYYQAVTLFNSLVIHLDAMDIGNSGDFSQCGHYSKDWLLVGPIKRHEVTCIKCLRSLKARGIHPSRSVHLGLYNSHQG